MVQKPICKRCINSVGAWKGWSKHMCGCEAPGVHRFERGMAQVGVEGEHIANAIENGWFDFPYNFDPVWIDSCKSFKPKSE
jgi:hypothetical protein